MKILCVIYHGGKRIYSVFNPIRHSKISITIHADASLEACGASTGIVSTCGAWLPDETLMHINVLELKAIILAVKSFVKTCHKRIKMSDNTTAIHCINKIRIFTSNAMSSQSSKNLGRGNYSIKSSFSS